MLLPIHCCVAREEQDIPVNRYVPSSSSFVHPKPSLTPFLVFSFSSFLAVAVDPPRTDDPYYVLVPVSLESRHHSPVVPATSTSVRRLFSLGVCRWRRLKSSSNTSCFVLSSRMCQFHSTRSTKYIEVLVSSVPPRTSPLSNSFGQSSNEVAIARPHFQGMKWIETEKTLPNRRSKPGSCRSADGDGTREARKIRCTVIQTDFTPERNAECRGHRRSRSTSGEGHECSVHLSGSKDRNDTIPNSHDIAQLYFRYKATLVMRWSSLKS